MKLFITHVSAKWGCAIRAKSGIEELVDYFPAEDITELSAISDSDKSSDRYIAHQGRILYSGGGEVKQFCIDDLLQEGEEEFVLTGGYFGGCHSETFEDLFRKAGARRFIFPLESIYDSFPLDMDYVLKRIERNYCEKSTVYWDNNIIQEGDDCTIRIFTTNGRLFDYLDSL